MCDFTHHEIEELQNTVVYANAADTTLLAKANADLYARATTCFMLDDAPWADEVDDEHIEAQAAKLGVTLRAF